jgi:ribosomal protein S18 acetylase RimI-like enzyme
MRSVAELRAQYDREMRRDPPLYPGTRVEREGPIVRVVGTENFVIFSDLGTADARSVVHEQAEYFRREGVEVEWKTFGHDPPEDLPEILAAEGFVADEPETLVLRDLRGSFPEATGPPGVDVRRVTDDAGLRDAATANAAAFGPSDQSYADRWAGIVSDPDAALFVAYLDGAPVGSGRVDLPKGRSFAGLYGGGTAPGFRHRGIYRSLVRARSALARDRGFSFVTVDARETSRPILERLGFVPITTTQGWVLRPGPAAHLRPG